MLFIQRTMLGFRIEIVVLFLSMKRVKKMTFD